MIASFLEKLVLIHTGAEYKLFRKASTCNIQIASF